jgi:hypothetical protein
MGIMKILRPLMVLVAGAGVGGGAAVATRLFIGPTDAKAHAAPADPASTFVKVEKVVAPLVLRDGNLSGYVAFDIELQVAPDQAAAVTAKLPLLLHAINMRTYRTPLAAGPDGMLPDIEGLRRVVMAAAPEALGPGVVRRAAITRAEPS